MSFKPCYVWPFKAFPFRIYFNSHKCRIFIIENLQHNFEWLLANAKKIKNTDFFFVIVGCYYHDALVNEASRMFDFLGLNKENFIILCNDERERTIFSRHEFSCELVNQNAWLDERLIPVQPRIEKKYDAIYVGRLIELKRHYLAKKINNLALVAGEDFGSKPADEIPAYTYLNDRSLESFEVFKKISEAHCGLILSDVEGASFASSEYLLCGIPVVSTKSLGGRDVWYDEYNSVVVEPNEDAVLEAVKYFLANPRNPDSIRERHIELAREYRNRFVCSVDKILASCDMGSVDAYKYFDLHFFHKMRVSITPEFDKIF